MTFNITHLHRQLICDRQPSLNFHIANKCIFAFNRNGYINFSSCRLRWYMDGNNIASFIT